MIPQINNCSKASTGTATLAADSTAHSSMIATSKRETGPGRPSSCYGTGQIPSSSQSLEASEDRTDYPSWRQARFPVLKVAGESAASSQQRGGAALPRQPAAWAARRIHPRMSAGAKAPPRRISDAASRELCRRSEPRRAPKWGWRVLVRVSAARTHATKPSRPAYGSGGTRIPANQRPSV